jgi:hypothetical protein
MVPAVPAVAFSTSVDVSSKALDSHPLTDSSVTLVGVGYLQGPTFQRDARYAVSRAEPDRL